MSSPVKAVSKTLREMLANRRYAIDYYQRDYRWETQQVEELLDDLTAAFLISYSASDDRSQVQHYPTYFLGPVILSHSNGAMYIVDGQQRLSTLTLLLIYLRNLQDEQDLSRKDPDVAPLIFSTQYGKDSFNLEIEERVPLLRSLVNGLNYFGSLDDPSVANLYARYQDIQGHFPDLCKGPVLPYFMDWVIDNTQFIEIVASSDDAAYTIFETMNDRGLSLLPSEMLKGFVLSRIDPTHRKTCGDVWQREIAAIGRIDKEAEDFFRMWFRSQYAQKTRSGALSVEQDYDRMGPEFHRWFKDTFAPERLTTAQQFADLVQVDMPFYSKWYQRIQRASKTFDPEMPAVFYNATREPSLKQEMLLLAPLEPQDSDAAALEKIRLMSAFLDIFIARRVWAVKNLTLPALRTTFLALARQVRGLSAQDLAMRLYIELVKPGADNFEQAPPILSNQNRKRIRALLARLTDFVEANGVSGNPVTYSSIMSAKGTNAYEIEHVWADHFDWHTDEFSDQVQFREHRNRLGGLVLLPKSVNASLSDLPWQEKIPKYATTSQNLLAVSLAPSCYRDSSTGEVPDTRPAFRKWLALENLAFHPYDSVRPFNKSAIDERTELYRQLAQRIWHPDAIFAGTSVNALLVKSAAHEALATIKSSDRSASAATASETFHAFEAILANLEFLEDDAAGAAPSAPGLADDPASFEVAPGVLYPCAATSAPSKSVIEATQAARRLLLQHGWSESITRRYGNFESPIGLRMSLVVQKNSVRATLPEDLKDAVLRQGGEYLGDKGHLGLGTCALNMEVPADVARLAAALGITP